MNLLYPQISVEEIEITLCLAKSTKQKLIKTVIEYEWVSYSKDGTLFERNYKAASNVYSPWLRI